MFRCPEQRKIFVYCLNLNLQTVRGAVRPPRSWRARPGGEIQKQREAGGGQGRAGAEDIGNTRPEDKQRVVPPVRGEMTSSASKRSIRRFVITEKAPSRFQPGEGPSRGLLRDYEPPDGPF